MKRFTSIVLLLFFLGGNSYGAYAIHYCGGKIKSISSVAKNKSCSKCGKESANDCCKTVNKLVKSDDFSKTKSGSGANVQVVLVKYFGPSLSFSFHSLVQQTTKLFLTDIPLQKVAVFIRVCSLVI